MKKILVISNSFGQDANRYLYGVCRSAGEEIKVVTLYIGGCTLYRHYRNMLSEEKAYSLELNGISSGFFVSLKEALLSHEWDIVTFQQASTYSGDYETYQPFLDELSAYVKKLVPKAKQYIHAIWAWSDSKLALSHLPYETAKQMYAADHAAYKKAAESISADGYIPSTAAMEKLYAKLGDAAYRDGFHANLGSARYMLALVWYMTIFGKDNIDGIDFSDFDIPVTDEEKKIAEACAIEAVKENNYRK